jgi:hypothetical protein
MARMSQAVSETAMHRLWYAVGTAENGGDPSKAPQLSCGMLRSTTVAPRGGKTSHEVVRDCHAFAQPHLNAQLLWTASSKGDWAACQTHQSKQHPNAGLMIGISTGED